MKRNNGNFSQLQQGDIILEKIDCDNFKKTLCKTTKKGWILAEGEEHNHFHRIEEIKKAEMFEYYDDYMKENCLLLKILEDQTELKHEEHESIYLDKGIYRVNKINEYDPFEKFSKKVVD